MFNPSPLGAGWYVTLLAPGEARSTRVVAYLYYVPEIGPFLITEVGSEIDLPTSATRWEWHGPFATPHDAWIVDLDRDPPRVATSDVWAA